MLLASASLECTRVKTYTEQKSNEFRGLLSDKALRWSSGPVIGWYGLYMSLLFKDRILLLGDTSGKLKWEMQRFWIT